MDALVIIASGLFGTCIFLLGIIQKQKIEKKELMKMIRDHQKEIKNFQKIIFNEER